MAAYFFDSSAIVKRYIVETGSVWVDGLLDPAMNNRSYLARIAGAEVVAAITRRARGNSISAIDAAHAVANFKRDYANIFNFVEVTPPLISSAITFAERHALRGYDAVQLAAAMEASRARAAAGLTPLTVVTADLELLAAAQSEGLTTEDPNTH